MEYINNSYLGGYQRMASIQNQLPELRFIQSMQFFQTVVVDIGMAEIYGCQIRAVEQPPVGIVQEANGRVD